MAKFFAGFILGILSMLGYNHFTSEEAIVVSKDTITVQVKDQTIEVAKDTFRKDSAR